LLRTGDGASQWLETSGKQGFSHSQAAAFMHDRRRTGSTGGFKLWGLQMRKGALLLALVMIAAAPTAALAAKKAKAPADPNAGGKKFVYELTMQPYYVWQNAWGFKPAAKKK
jgi:hypothetical protein